MGFSYDKNGYYQYTEDDPVKQRLKKIIIAVIILLIIVGAFVIFLAFFVHEPEGNHVMYIKNDLDAIKDQIKEGSFDVNKYYR